MKQFRIVPKIIEFNTVQEFLQEFRPGNRDLILTSRSIYYDYFADNTAGAHVVFIRDYGSGEPTDEMVERVQQDMKGIGINRVFAIGGGTVLDVGKLLALKQCTPVSELFDGTIKIERNKELILVPTTCGTGSEVTNVTVLELISRKIKIGLAEEAFFGDCAVLIPELLTTLPMKYFATGSIDALIHAVEAYTSPKANAFTRLYSLEAIKMILSGYRRMERYGANARQKCLGDFLTAATYAGIAFGNAGCAAVHAMSYPFGGTFHIPHGEANYAIFIQVYKTYRSLKPEGRIQELNSFLGKLLGCNPSEAYEALEKLLNTIFPKKALREYGVTPEDIENFTEAVMTGQSRLMSNNYVPLNRDTVKKIYMELL